MGRRRKLLSWMATPRRRTCGTCNWTFSRQDELLPRAVQAVLQKVLKRLTQNDQEPKRCKTPRAKKKTTCFLHSHRQNSSQMRKESAGVLRLLRFPHAMKRGAFTPSWPYASRLRCCPSGSSTAT